MDVNVPFHKSVSVESVAERLVALCAMPAEARAIAEWPDDFLVEITSWAASGGAADDAIHRTKLEHYGLARDGRLTSLGDTIRYHLDEFRWQKGRGGLDGVLEVAQLGEMPRILDVGCGAGQSLRRLEPDRPVARVGIDRDPVAVALGARFARLEGIDMQFVAGDALPLPFQDAAFDLTMSRVAINYMHQASALGEMVRVTRSRGYVLCRAENIRHDLSGLVSARSPKAVICRIRDLALGSFHTLTGWQPTPGSRLRGGRAFTSPRRLARIFQSLGCEIVHSADSPNGPTFAGGRTQSIVVARKTGIERLYGTANSTQNKHARDEQTA